MCSLRQFLPHPLICSKLSVKRQLLIVFGMLQNEYEGWHRPQTGSHYMGRAVSHTCTHSHAHTYTWALKKKIRKIKANCLLDLGFTSRNNGNSPETQEKSKLCWVKFLIPPLPRYFVLTVAPSQKTVVGFWVYDFSTPNLSNHIMYYPNRRSLSREIHPRPDIISGRMSLEALTLCYL